MTEQASRDRQGDIKLTKEQERQIKELTQITRSYFVGEYVPVTPASWYFERFSMLLAAIDKAEKALREQTEETARWICKYNGDASRFQRQKKELAATEQREKKLRIAIESAIACINVEAFRTACDGLEEVLSTLYPSQERGEEK